MMHSVLPDQLTEKGRGDYYSQRGIFYESLFRTEALRRGLEIFAPVNPHSPFDVVVFSGGRFTAVQVKGTSTVREEGGHPPSFTISSYQTNTNGRKISYAELGVGVIAIFIEPLESWYLVPLTELKSKNLRVYLNTGMGNISQYLENWNVFCPTPKFDDVI